MGYDGGMIKYWKNGKVDMLAEFYDRWNDDNYSVVDARKIGSTIYSAIKKNENDYVFGMVSLVRLDRGYVLFKDMSEDMHPFFYDCPKSILRLLSPTDNKNSLEWRNGCLNYQEGKKTSKAYFKNSNVGDLFIFNDQKIIKHCAPSYQFQTEWWGVVESNGNVRSYIPKKDVRPENIADYTRENVIASFNKTMDALSSKCLDFGLERLFIGEDSERYFELPMFYSTLVCEGIEKSGWLPCDLRVIDGEAVFGYGNLQYKKENFPEECRHEIEKFETAYEKIRDIYENKDIAKEDDIETRVEKTFKKISNLPKEIDR